MNLRFWTQTRDHHRHINNVLARFLRISHVRSIRSVSTQRNCSHLCYFIALSLHEKQNFVRLLCEAESR